MTDVKGQTSNFRDFSQIWQKPTLRLMNWLKCGDATCSQNTPAEKVPLPFLNNILLFAYKIHANDRDNHANILTGFHPSMLIT